MRFLLKLITLTTLLITNCCAYRPILNPDQKYQEMGQEAANQDVEQCLEESEEYLKQYKAEKIRKAAAREALAGAVIGAATGAIFGQNLKSAGVGTLIGLGAGAILGGASSAAEGKIKPDHIKQNYVNQCLGNKGYSVLGWQ